MGQPSIPRRPRTPTCCPIAAPGSRSRTAAISIIAVEGDKRLFNQYGVMLVNPAEASEREEGARPAFIDWLVSPDGQKAIADYKINGEQLFYPNAGDPGA